MILINIYHLKLFYIAKAVDTTSVQYKKTTPNDVIYEGAHCLFSVAIPTQVGAGLMQLSKSMFFSLVVV